jgi:hypothetical protein
LPRGNVKIAGICERPLQSANLNTKLRFLGRAQRPGGGRRTLATGLRRPPPTRQGCKVPGQTPQPTAFGHEAGGATRDLSTSKGTTNETCNHVMPTHRIVFLIDVGKRKRPGERSHDANSPDRLPG